jgi:hypothetical protein
LYAAVEEEGLTDDIFERFSLIPYIHASRCVDFC